MSLKFSSTAQHFLDTMNIFDNCLIFHFDENCVNHDWNSTVHSRKIGLDAMNVKFECQKGRCVQVEKVE